MTVESNNYYAIAIAIATLSDWLKILAPVFQSMRSKNQNQSHHVHVIFSRTLSELHIIARNFDWFIVLFVPVVIGHNNCFGFGFSTVI